ncbi:polysaccharide biosynthesis tyrosine autokinase [Brasilonema sp. CT11]|nr:polysaccharide biosynthesis tyrosine autokinase [Brasilonema sp. CT11]
MVQSSLSPYGNPVTESEPGYGQLFAILIRRFPWFLAAFVASIAVAGVMTKRTAPTYRSSMQLLVEPNYQGTKESSGGVDSQFTDPTVQVDAATQLSLMQSSPLLKKAVTELKREYPDMTVGQLKSSLVLSQIKNKEDNVATKIFEVQYTGKDPIKTHKVLQGIQKVYLGYNIQQQNERLRKGLKVIQEQLNGAKNEVTRAEGELRDFRTGKNLTGRNLIDPETQAKATQDELTRIQQERGTTRSLYKEAEATLQNIQKQLQSTPQNALVEARLSQSTRYQGLLNEIQKTELSLAQERLRFTEEAPSVQKLAGQLQSQKALLQEEQKRTLGGESVPNTQAPSLLEQGQKSAIDLNLAAKLVDTQTTMLSLSAKDQVLEKKERELSEQLTKFPKLLADYSRLQPQVQLSRERLQELLKAEQRLRQEIAKGGFNWEIVEEPQEGTQLGPNLQQNLMLGAVVGLMLGGIAAFIREAADDSVHTTAELERQMSLPILGTTPKLPPAKTRESVIKLPFGKPDVPAPWTIQVLQSSPRWESLDLIYKNIELLNSVASFKSLMITSALSDDGKSGLALGLAMSAARLHKRVLLIDANLREPSLHKQLNLPNEQGLSTLLASEVTIPNQISIQSSGSSYIDILTAGPTPADPANLLSSPRMQQLMASFEKNYDLVLVDSTPVLGLVDAMLTASSCRGVVMVASIGRVTRTQLTQATAMLSRLNLLGVVANGVSNSSSTFVPYTHQQRFALQQAVEK